MKIAWKCFFCTMMFPPFSPVQFSAGSAVRSASSIKIELNGKMTGRLQIGNVGSGTGKGGKQQGRGPT
jgi:hypothetical protein